MLMEKLRVKSKQQRSWTDISRSIRINMLEKRYALDSVEKSNLQKAMDTMQAHMKVTSRQSLVERLASLSRQLGLKFLDDRLTLFMSSELFYLEIILNQAGGVHDVKVHHDNQTGQQSQELIDCLVSGDYADFTAQLKSWTSVYITNTSVRVEKTNTYKALLSLEADLHTMYTINAQTNDAAGQLFTSVGIVAPRRGGHSMRVSYSVHAYNLVDRVTGNIRPIMPDLFSGPSAIGMSAIVHIEETKERVRVEQPDGSVKQEFAKYRLPTQATVNVPHGRTIDFVPLTEDNSALVPATFVLHLVKPLVIDMELLAAIEAITECKFPDELKETNDILLNLIVAHSGDGQVKMTPNGLIVQLPDQKHCYFMDDNSDMRERKVSYNYYSEVLFLSPECRMKFSKNI